MSRAASILLLLCLAGCDVDPTSQPIHRNDILGLYKANYQAGELETIELKQDSTYIYSFKPQTGAVMTISDRYVYLNSRQDSAGAMVLLHNFKAPYPLDGTCYRPGNPHEAIQTEAKTLGFSFFKDKDGNISIVRCPDEKQYYVKVR